MTSRETPVSATNSSERLLNASMRVSSTHTVRVPAAAGAEVPVSSGAAEVVSSVVASPPHAASVRASPAVVASRMLRRISVSPS